MMNTHQTMLLLLLALNLVSVSFGWRAVSTTGPRPPFRSSPSWGVIPGTSDIYLFGGLYDNFDTNNNIMTNDLYKYSAPNSFQGTWQQIHGWTSVAGIPSARAFSGYTTTTKGLYVYGGAYYTNPFAPTTLGDFWVYDVTAKSWTQIVASSAQTPGLLAASALTSVGDDAIYLYGGIDATSTVKGDLWKYKPSTNSWSVISVGGSASNKPPAMENHIMINSGNLLYVGFGETFENFQFGITVGMWSVNVGASSPTWSYINPPSTPSPPRNYVGAVVADGPVVIFGGDISGGATTCGSPFDQNATNQTYLYSPLTGKWKQSVVCPGLEASSAKFPGGIKRHRSLYVPHPIIGGVIYTFGGYAWNANSTTCATRQEWYGDIFALTYAELLAGLTC